MNYKKHYAKLIRKRLKDPITEGYIEKHHIHPISLGGTNEYKNLINLTAKEHFIAHLLLTRMYRKGSRPYYKMVKAFGLMCWYHSGNQDGRYVTSNEYAWLREEYAKAMSLLQQGKNNSSYGTMWIYSEELRESKKIPKDSEIPEGWVKGRVKDFDARDDRLLEKKKNKFEKLLTSTKLKEFERLEKVRKYTKWYKIYDDVGFKDFCHITNYSGSVQNLTQHFRNHVKRYKSKMGSPRGGVEKYIPSEELKRRITEKLAKDGAIPLLNTYEGNRIPFTFICACGNKVSTKNWNQLNQEIYKARCLGCYKKSRKK